MKFLKESDIAPADIYYASGYIGSKWPSINQKKFSDTKVIVVLKAFVKDVRANEEWCSTDSIIACVDAEEWLNVNI